MSEPRKNHLTIDGAQVKDVDHADSYKPVPEADQEFRSSKSSLGKSKEKVSSDPAEEKLLSKEDEVKITPMGTEAKYDHRNGDTKIELDAAKKQFSGLTKEELLKYADDPFWVRLRWFMFVLFWALWLAMLAGAIAIIVNAPKCAPPPAKTWYELGPLVDYSSESPVEYGKLEADLPALESAKVLGVFINPCENTYDVLDDNTCIDKFREFLEKAKKTSIKFIVDLTANFVPTSHPWFKQSENKSQDYDGFFVWGTSKEYEEGSDKPKKPNNWISLYNDVEAWSWSDQRKEYYLHQYREHQADLNFHNEAVINKFDLVLNKWVEAGVGGVRLLKARQLLVNSSLPDEKMNGKASDAVVKQYDFYNHRATSDQPELDELFAHWSHLVTKGGDNVFTIHEDGRLLPEWYKFRNSTALRPPSAAPRRLAGDVAAFAADLQHTTGQWPALQLSSESVENDELATLAMLLPATPVLKVTSLPTEDNTTLPSELFGHLSELRHEASIKYGQRNISAVPANDSPARLLAAARWKAGQPGYVCVYNPTGTLERANLTALPSLPATLTAHHVSQRVREDTGYSPNTPVQANNVTVPAYSAVVLSYVPVTTVEE